MDYEQFKNRVKTLLNMDLNLYKEKQMKRRINTHIQRRGASDYNDFWRLLNTDVRELKLFKSYVTINVTEFFRDPEHWEYLEQTVLPDLIQRFGEELTIWCSACSTGEEAYSLAIALALWVPLEKIHIIATDVDEDVLAVAREGVYSAESVKNISPDALERFFIKEGDGEYRVTEELRNCVEFGTLDLHHDAYPQGCHLITCRNVLIYFTTEAKDLIFRGFANSLCSGGCLFLGRAEQIIHWKESSYIRLNSSFYQRS